VALFLATLHPENGWSTSSERPQPERDPLARTRLQSVRWRTWGRNALVYLGRISYGLYVFHILGLMISDYTVHHPETSLGRFLFHNAVAFAFTVVFAAISYRWLETPFLNLKQRFTRVLSRPGA
jgi:peptidoglycan/LPS O-acetylase OafA/YrhL